MAKKRALPNLLDGLEGGDVRLLATVLRSMAAAVEGQLEPANRKRRASKHLSLLDWSKRYLPAHIVQEPSAMHRWTCERCDDSRQVRGSKVNLLGPRANGKSTHAALAHPLRCAVEGWEPLIWIISEVKDQASDLLEHIKEELTNNERLARDYPDATGGGRLWRKDKVRLRNGVVIQAFGVGMKIRGRRSGANRPTLVICDDVQGNNVMTSVNKRVADWSWFNSALLKAGTKRTNYINLATALHRDAIGLRLDRQAGWTSRVFRSIEEWPANLQIWEEWAAIYHDMESPDRTARAEAFYREHQAEMDAGARVLWPEEEDLYTLMRLREEDRTAFEREKQGRPVNPEECEFPEAYFEAIEYFDRWPDDSELRWKVLSLDPSKGKSDKSDYSAFTLIAMDKRADLWIDADLKRRDTRTIVDDGITIFNWFRPHAFGVEINQFQEVLADVFEDRSKALGVLLPLHGITNTENKRTRIRSTLTPYLARGRMRLRRNSPGAALLLDQLRGFPLDKHDDGPDSLEQGIKLLAHLQEHGLAEPE